MRKFFSPCLLMASLLSHNALAADYTKSISVEAIELIFSNDKFLYEVLCKSHSCYRPCQKCESRNDDCGHNAPGYQNFEFEFLRNYLSSPWKRLSYSETESFDEGFINDLYLFAEKYFNFHLNTLVYPTTGKGNKKTENKTGSEQWSSSNTMLFDMSSVKRQWASFDKYHTDTFSSAELQERFAEIEKKNKRNEKKKGWRISPPKKKKTCASPSGTKKISQLRTEFHKKKFRLCTAREYKTKSSKTNIANGWLSKNRKELNLPSNLAEHIHQTLLISARAYIKGEDKDIDTNIRSVIRVFDIAFEHIAKLEYENRIAEWLMQKETANDLARFFIDQGYGKEMSKFLKQKNEPKERASRKSKFWPLKFSKKSKERKRIKEWIDEWSTDETSARTLAMLRHFCPKTINEKE